ncbi:hypothetical protein ACTXT7_003364 [Hymenolepis weldensis]
MDIINLQTQHFPSPTFQLTYLTPNQSTGFESDPRVSIYNPSLFFPHPTDKPPQFTHPSNFLAFL